MSVESALFKEQDISNLLNPTFNSLTIKNDVNFKGNLNITGNLGVTGISNLSQTNINGNLGVTGNVNIIGVTNTENINATSISMSSFTVNGKSILNFAVPMNQRLDAQFGISSPFTPDFTLPAGMFYYNPTQSGPIFNVVVTFNNFASTSEIRLYDITNGIITPTLISNYSNGADPANLYISRSIILSNLRLTDGIYAFYMVRTAGAGTLPQLLSAQIYYNGSPI